MERRNNPGMALVLAISLAIGMLLVSCTERGSPSAGGEPPSVDVTGRWTLRIKDVETIQQLPADYSVALDLNQADSIISGSALTSDGRAGSVVGQVSGTRVINFKIDIDPAEGDLFQDRHTLSGTATVNGEKMELELVLNLGPTHSSASTIRAQASATRVK